HVGRASQSAMPIDAVQESLHRTGTWDQQWERWVAFVRTCIHGPTSQIVEAMKSGHETWTMRFTAAAVLSRKPDDPETCFYAHMTILDSLWKSEWRNLVEPDFERVVVESWSRITNEMRFALRNPSTTVPAIQGAINDPLTSGCRKVARIIDAARDAVSTRLP